MAVAVACPSLDHHGQDFQRMHNFNPDAPEFKPLDVPTLRPDAAEFIPTAGGWATLQAAADAYAQRVKRQMPFATDEEWVQRIAKREKEVETIKLLQSYMLYIDAIPKEAREDREDEPRTPNPRDRSISKRMWKWNVERWRLQLKGRCVYPRETMLECWAIAAASADVKEKVYGVTAICAVPVPDTASTSTLSAAAIPASFSSEADAIGSTAGVGAGLRAPALNTMAPAPLGIGLGPLGKREEFQ